MDWLISLLYSLKGLLNGDLSKVSPKIVEHLGSGLVGLALLVGAYFAAKICSRYIASAVLPARGCDAWKVLRSAQFLYDSNWFKSRHSGQFRHERRWCDGSFDCGGFCDRLGLSRDAEQFLLRAYCCWSFVRSK